MNRGVLGFALGLLTVAALFGVAGGCNGEVAHTASPASSRVEQSVGAAGGVVLSSDGQVSIEIPPGALTTDVVVTITPLEGASVSDTTTVGTAYRFGPSGTSFAKAVTVTLPFEAARIPSTRTSKDVRMMTAADGSSVYAALDTTVADATHVRAQTTQFGIYVAVVPVAVVSNGGDRPDATTFPGESCTVTCEGPDNIDGRIGCSCGVTCNGVVYRLSCVCGECTCFQDGVPGKTTSMPISACDFGATSLMGTYFQTCGYPGSKNSGGGGGPTSNDAGGSCPGK